MALISEQLTEFHANDAETLIDIQGANDLLCKGNINNASYMLQKIIYRSTEDQDEVEKHLAIFNEAESFATRSLEEMSNGTFPEILMQKPKNLEFPEEAMKEEQPVGAMPVQQPQQHMHTQGHQHHQRHNSEHQGGHQSHHGHHGGHHQRGGHHHQQQQQPTGPYQGTQRGHRNYGHHRGGHGGGMMRQY